MIDATKLDYRATIITTASPQKQNNKYAKKAKEDLTKLGIKKIEFCDVEQDNLIFLKSSNIVYIVGGNPFYLLNYLKKSGAEKILKQLHKEETVFIGVSAGAMVLGPSIGVANFFTPEMNQIALADFKALGLTTMEVFPHYDRVDLFKNEAEESINVRLKRFESINNRTLIRLKDQAFIFDSSH
jgi:dipeptidase E